MKYLYIITLTFLLLSSNTQAQCDGAVVHSQKELDSLFTGCTVITGLILGEEGVENDIHDLSALSDLSELHGNLYIRNTQLVDLNQMNKLLAIEGSIFIYNNPLLTNIYFERFAFVEYNFEIYDCPLLETITGHFPPQIDKGFVKLINNPQLHDISIFDNFGHTNGAVIIKDCPRLKNLDGLKNLQKSKRLSLENCDSLTDLSHLSNLRFSNDIEILNLPIQKLDFLNQVDSLTWFTISNCRQLKDLSGLKGWEASIQYFTFNNTDSLRSLAAFDSIRVWKELYIEDHQALDTLGFNVMSNPLEEVFISNTTLKKLNGLKNLKRVNHWIEISNHPQLLNLSDLNNLERVERDIPGLNSLGLYLRDLPVLQTQNLLPKLEFCSGRMELKNCGMGALMHFDALTGGNPDLFIRECPNLKYLNAFNQIKRLRYLRIVQNPNLQVIEGFEQLKNASFSLEVSENANLHRINCFDKINHTSVGLRSNPLLLNIIDFSALQNGAIGIFDMPFETIDFLPNLDTISTISIHDNKNLNSLEGLSYPIHTDNSSYNSISIKRNKKLKNLKGLDSLTNLINTYLYIDENENLENLKGLDNLISTDDDIRIYNNPDLKSISSLHHLKTVGEAFEIINNPQLFDITGLVGLDTIYEYLEISGNPLLSDCRVLCMLDENTVVEEGIELFGNAETCNDMRDILEICENDTTVSTTYPTLSNLLVYPNPASDVLFVQLEKDLLVQILIFDQLGRLVEVVSNEGDSVFSVDVSAYLPGIYFCRIEQVGREKILGSFKWRKI